MIQGVSCFLTTFENTAFASPGPALSGCVLGVGRDVFVGGRSRERCVLKRFCNDSTNNLSPFVQRSQMMLRRPPPKVTSRVAPRHAVFITFLIYLKLLFLLKPDIYLCLPVIACVHVYNNNMPNL